MNFIEEKINIDNADIIFELSKRKNDSFNFTGKFFNY